MSGTSYRNIIVLAVLLTVLSTAAKAQPPPLFSAAELDELMAPIALYPDPLLAQVLPAATHLDQLQQAVPYAGQSGYIETQSWDLSVKAVAHYPSVLYMMVDNPDWTIAVGQAYVTQPVDVMNSIQRLREKATMLGYLRSNAEQLVYTEDGLIRIVPAQAQYIYVPYYNPQVVYVERRPSYVTSAITFGIGLLIGVWLNRDINWYRHNIYYHGWRGTGWISRSRRHVHVNNRYYVNSRYANRPPAVNRRITDRNISSYRRQLSREAGTYRLPARVRPVYPAARPGVPPPRPGVGAGPRRPPTRPSARPTVPPTRPPTRPEARPSRPPTRPTAPAVRPPTRRTAPTPRPPATRRTAPPTRPGVTAPPPTARPRTRPEARPTRPPQGAGPRRPEARPAPPSARPSAPRARPAPRPEARPSRPPRGTGPGRPEARPSRPAARSEAPTARPSRPPRGARPGRSGARPTRPAPPSARPSAPPARQSPRPEARPSRPPRGSGSGRPETRPAHPASGGHGGGRHGKHE